MRFLRSDHVSGWLFVLPATLLLVAFQLVPIGWSALLSLQHNDLVTPPHYVGLANYQALRHDPTFRRTIHNTIEYTLLFVPISIVALAGRRRRAQQAGAAGQPLQDRRLRSGGRVDRGNGDRLQLAARPDVRARQLVPERARVLVAGVLHEPRPGDVRHRRHDRLGLARVRRDHLPGGTAGHPPGAARGRGHRRRGPLGDVPVGDPAAARARPRCSWSSGRRSTRCSSSTRSTTPPAAARSARPR